MRKVFLNLRNIYKKKYQNYAPTQISPLKVFGLKLYLFGTFCCSFEQNKYY